MLKQYMKKNTICKKQEFMEKCIYVSKTYKNTHLNTNPLKIVCVYVS